MLDLRAFTIGAIGLSLFGLVAPRLGHRRWATSAAPYAREAGVIVGLYVLWQLLLDVLVTRVQGATAHGMWVWRLERTLRLPSEAAAQRLVLPHPLLVQASNGYYSGLHFPAMIGCLIWLFARHPERYAWFRTALISSTGLCALVQAIPVAPPRLLSGLRLVDTGVRYGQSDYAPGGLHDPGQLIAMPSVHVGWAVLVAVAVVAVSRSRWRWLALLYPATTMFIVVDTANHFWMDGIVAGAILAVVLLAQWSVARVRSGRTPALAVPTADDWPRLTAARAEGA